MYKQKEPLTTYLSNPGIEPSPKGDKTVFLINLPMLIKIVSYNLVFKPLNFFDSCIEILLKEQWTMNPRSRNNAVVSILTKLQNSKKFLK